MNYLNVGSGDTERIKSIQKILSDGGLLSGPVDGIFGIKTKYAIQTLQRLFNINSDGIVGPITRQALEKYSDFISRGASNFSFVEESPIAQRINFTEKYYQSFIPKGRIVLHHTASDGNEMNVKNWWEKSGESVATAFVIGETGRIIRLFDERKWSWHLGIGRTAVDASSIGIEICNWGFLTYENGKFYNYVKKEISREHVVDLGYEFRQKRYWHKYTPEQLEACKKLVLGLLDFYDIPAIWHGFDLLHENNYMDEGLFTHTNFNRFKMDCSPQESFLNMIEEIIKEAKA